MPVVDVAMNVEADRIEASTGRRIMNTCHGFWSVGSIIGGLSGAAFASLEVDIRWHLAIVAAISLPIALFVALATAAHPGRAARRPEERRFRIALPTLSLLPLCLFAFGMLLVEAAALDWSSVFLRSVMGATPFGAGIGFAAFTIAMAVGRFLGDWAAGRFGPVAVARGCGLIGLAGLVVLVTAPVFLLAVVGLAAIGLGVSVAVPLAVSAAASRGDRPACGQCRCALADLVQRLSGRAAAGRLRRGMGRQSPDRLRHAPPGHRRQHPSRRPCAAGREGPDTAEPAVRAGRLNCGRQRARAELRGTVAGTITVPFAGLARDMLRMCSMRLQLRGGQKLA